MTLKSKYFQADSLINLHSLAAKSARAIKKNDLHGMSGNFYLKSGEQTKTGQQQLIVNIYPKPLGKIVFSPFRKFS